MSSLGNHEKQLLLLVARRSLISAVGRESLDIPAVELVSRESHGAFVTLRRGRRLRGCIGQIAANESLVEVVAYSTRAAALEDPRFQPVCPDELADIDIELSILSPPEEIPPDRIEAGKHGLIVSRGWQRGVLLPQVATEYRWGALRFLEETCVKAGFEREGWKDPGTRIQGFTAEIFSELEFPPGNQVDPQRRSKSPYSTST